MPELPDLQVFSKNLHNKLEGKQLKNIKVVRSKRVNVDERELKKALEHHVLKQVRREGKELHFVFDNDQVLGLHLMLKGGLNFFDNTNDGKYPVLELVFDDGSGMALHDPRGMATTTLNPEVNHAPDALASTLNFSTLKKLLDNKSIIKKTLMDQDVIRGIGNAYADEILWHARISPFSVCNKIPDEKIKVLLKTMKQVLKGAEKKIDKEHPGIISGEVRDFLDIHNANKKSSPTGAAIKIEMINGRKTYFTDEQELFV